MKLWYDKPAGPHWNCALPIGNGRLGAMIFGNVESERIQLNEDSVWNGGPRDRINPSTKEKLPVIRQLINEGKLSEAHTLVNDAMAGIPDSMRCYEPLGDLLIEFTHPGVDSSLSGDELANAAGLLKAEADTSGLDFYRRSLDLEKALAEVSYSIGGITYRRTHLASAVDGVIAIRFEASQAGALGFRLRMERGPRESYSTRYADTLEHVEGHGQIMKGRAGGEDGVRFAACFRVRLEGGTQELIGDTLVVSDATAAVLVFSAATSFREESPADFVLEQSLKGLDRAWESIVADHVADHGKYFNRATISLPSPKEIEELPLNQRLERLRAGESDPALDALYFHFGRYLLISSSRPGSLPATLQGIWNEDFWPAWGAKYTININTEMNYWPSEPANLAELNGPLFDHLERMLPNGRKTAERMYGCRGFVCHHNTDIWGDTTPTDRNLGASYWLMGGAWLSLHLWEHYAYGQDQEFLKRAYHLLKESSLFFLDFLVPNRDGKLIVLPSSSPENVYRLPNGQTGTMCEGTTMDSGILDKLFRATRDAAGILGVDQDFAESVEAARQKLPQPSIGKNGGIMEWPEDFEETDPQHRHVSHLFLVHPGDQITPHGTPELAAAAEKTLTLRGDEGTGWCMAWKACFWARLGHGDRAYRLLQNLIRPVDPAIIGLKSPSTHGGGSYPNFFCAHPPFQIDGNFGGTTAIIEMLLQSHSTETLESGETLPVIQLLPALPPTWSEGSFRGLRARGGIEIDLEWSEGKPTNCTIRSSRATTILLRIGTEVHSLDLEENGSISLSSEQF